MKHLKNTILSALLSSLLFTTASSAQTESGKDALPTNSLFPKGEKLSNQYFTGNAFLQPLAARDKNNDFALGSVTFEPGARTIWHTHPKGQVLIVTEGEGFYQEKGKPARALKKGDVVNIPENTEHWHGASNNIRFAHIAITNYKGDENVVWLQPVTSEQYNSAIQKQPRNEQ
jgi:quercetin dioxygenase-like cupin family protein